MTMPGALPAGWLKVDALDIEAQGVARRADGKVVFIEGALPFELVSANVHRKKNNWEQASLTAIHRESAQRVTPGCRFEGMAHLEEYARWFRAFGTEEVAETFREATK